jgi:Flp pilus assembly CpaE family ATPase
MATATSAPHRLDEGPQLGADLRHPPELKLEGADEVVGLLNREESRAVVHGGKP